MSGIIEQVIPAFWGLVLSNTDRIYLPRVVVVDVARHQALLVLAIRAAGDYRYSPLGQGLGEGILWTSGLASIATSGKSRTKGCSHGRVMPRAGSAATGWCSHEKDKLGWCGTAGHAPLAVKPFAQHASRNRPRVLGVLQQLDQAHPTPTDRLGTTNHIRYPVQ